METIITKDFKIEDLNNGGMVAVTKINLKMKFPPVIIADDKSFFLEKCRLTTAIYMKEKEWKEKYKDNQP